MKSIDWLVRGPFKDEQEFKQAVLKAFKRKDAKYRYTHFEIENEEKEAGMPDTLSISAEAPAYFTEIKYADKNGAIKFTKAQPLFYGQHRDLCIQILAWDGRHNRVVVMHPGEIIRAKSLRIVLPEHIEPMDNYDPEDDR
jgi:hypothetical protein